MNTVYSILVSDGAVVLHFLLTMVLLLTVIVRGIHSDLRLRRFASENTDLRRQLGELSEFTLNCVQDLRDDMARQRDAICHTSDYLAGTVALDVTRFDTLYEEPPGGGSFAGSGLITVDLVSEPAEPDLSMVESAFVAPGPDYHEPDVSLPLKASMVTMPASVDAMIDSPDETSRDSSDIMTRVLQQSRGA